MMQSAHFTAALPNQITVRDSGANQHACSVFEWIYVACSKKDKFMIWSHTPCFSCMNTKMSVKKVGNIFFLPCTHFSFFYKMIITLIIVTWIKILWSSFLDNDFQNNYCTFNIEFNGQSKTTVQQNKHEPQTGVRVNVRVRVSGRRWVTSPQLT